MRTEFNVSKSDLTLIVIWLAFRILEGQAEDEKMGVFGIAISTHKRQYSRTPIMRRSVIQKELGKHWS